MEFSRVFAAYLLALVVVQQTVCQTAQDFCSYKSPTMIKSISLKANKDSDWSNNDACRCVISMNFNSSEGEYRLLTMSVDFQYSSGSGQSVPLCLPMLSVSMNRRSDADIANPLGISYNICPGIDDMKHHTATSMVYKGQELVLHMYNPGRATINSEIVIDEFGGTMSVQCSDYERILYDEVACPCMSTDHYTWMDDLGRASQFDEKRRLTIGLVTAFIFALIIVAIIVGCIFYKRRKAKKAHSTTAVAIVENKAYEGSKQSIATDQKQQLPQKEPAVSFVPDPSLNLKLQQPAHHGSRDSGLASSNENSDKRLPFMQPTAASHSLDNVSQMPANYPPLAGQGSQSSLDKITPDYMTRQPANVPPHMLGRNPERDATQNYPPLAGHGSQSSLDKPSPYPGDVDTLYAKPMKCKVQPEVKYSSLDKLNYDAPSLTKDEQFHSAESVSGHTEV